MSCGTVLAALYWQGETLDSQYGTRIILLKAFFFFNCTALVLSLVFKLLTWFEKV